MITNNVFIQQLKEQVLAFLGNENVKIVVFGSRIRGDNIASSDIDIGIIPKGVFNRGRLALLREDIDDSNIPYNVDIVDLSTTSEQFKKEALKDVEIWKD